MSLPAFVLLPCKSFSLQVLEWSSPFQNCDGEFYVST